MSYHHPFSPSSLGRRRLCPGSFQLEQGAPERGSSSAATEGTMLHSVMAAMISGNHRVIEEEAAKSLNVEQRNVINQCLAWFWDMFDESSKRDPFGDYSVETGVECEQRLRCHHRVGGETATVLTEGTADLVAFRRETTSASWQSKSNVTEVVLQIVDWKFGRNVLDTTNARMQMFGYAIAAYEHYNDISQSWKSLPITKVECWINQPRLGTLYHEVIDKARLPSVRKQVKDTILACQVEEPVLNPSPSACAYCKALPICPAVQEMGSNTVAKILDGGIVTDPTDRVTDLVDGLGPEELGGLYDQAKVVESYVKALKDMCKNIMVDGGNIDGWTVRTRRGRRKFSNNFEAVSLLRDTVPIDRILSHGSLKLDQLGFLLKNTEITRGDILRHANINVSGVQREYAAAQSEKHGTSRAHESKEFLRITEKITSLSDDVHVIVKEDNTND